MAIPLSTPPQRSIIIPVFPSSSSFFYSASVGSDVSDDLLDQCAKLFSTNYGVWGEKATSVSKFTKPGQSVKMSGRKLRSQCLSVPESTVLVTCFKDVHLIGHAFATVWTFDGGVMGWVAQLVVDAMVRKRYIAMQLLQTLKSHSLFKNINTVGLVSAHPAACDALAKYSNVKVNLVDTTFISQHAKNIFSVIPIEYLKDIKLQGSLFEDKAEPGVISSVYTKFFVDHTELLEALTC